MDYGSGNTSVMYGGNNNGVVIENRQGNNVMYGGIRNDVIQGNKVDNTIRGGYGNDTIVSLTVNNTLRADEGYDVIYGAKGEGGGSKGIIVRGPGFHLLENASVIRNCEQYI
jgi:Ca2+-binding RTX toxin-like protein